MYSAFVVCCLYDIISHHNSHNQPTLAACASDSTLGIMGWAKTDRSPSGIPGGVGSLLYSLSSLGDHFTNPGSSRLSRGFLVLCFVSLFCSFAAWTLSVQPLESECSVISIFLPTPLWQHGGNIFFILRILKIEKILCARIRVYFTAQERFLESSVRRTLARSSHRASCSVTQQEVECGGLRP